MVTGNRSRSDESDRRVWVEGGHRGHITGPTDQGEADWVITRNQSEWSRATEIRTDTDRLLTVVPESAGRVSASVFMSEHCSPLNWH